MGKLFKLAEKLGLRNYLKTILQEEMTIRQLTHDTLHLTESGVTDSSRDPQVIVSLTSFGERAHDVYLTVESLLQQSIQPDKIILWLNEPFTQDTLPGMLQKQQARGLEVRIVPDYRSYDKLIHALQEYPEAVIITVDDDMVYPFDFMEHLLYKHTEDPQAIWFYRGHRIRTEADGLPMAYTKWKGEEAQSDDSILNFPTGVGGVLYPPHSLHPQVLDVELFQQLAPTADDIWFRAMSLLQGTPCRRVLGPRRNFAGTVVLSAHQDTGLFLHNTTTDANDRQLRAVFNHFNLFDLYRAQ